jgi:hypothetical protein
MHGGSTTTSMHNLTGREWIPLLSMHLSSHHHNAPLHILPRHASFGMKPSTVAWHDIMSSYYVCLLLLLSKLTHSPIPSKALAFSYSFKSSCLFRLYPFSLPPSRFWCIPFHVCPVASALLLLHHRFNVAWSSYTASATISASSSSIPLPLWSFFNACMNVCMNDWIWWINWYANCYQIVDNMLKCIFEFGEKCFDNCDENECLFDVNWHRMHMPILKMVCQIVHTWVINVDM